LRVALFKGPHQPLAIEDIPLPDPGKGEVLMKVARCGICGTDLHATEGDHPTAACNSRLGHEYAGEVVGVGAGVSGLAEGDRIAAMPVGGCGACDACLAGLYIFCGSRTYYRGGFGEYLIVKEALALKLPGTVSLEEGALVEPLAVTHHALRYVGGRRPDRVAILGAGPVGLSALVWLKRLGVGKVSVVSRSTRRAALAVSLGADSFVLDGPDAVHEVRESLGGAPGLVLECAGVPGAIAAAIGHVQARGQIIALGFCHHPDSFIPSAALAKGLSMQFSIAYDLSDFQRCVDAFDAGWLDPTNLVTSTISLDALPQRFEALRAGAPETKVMVNPWLTATAGGPGQ
jgi:(R,R)-butanediol dehydrogenase/meso-butanediol dehydrogenase/diacetyl reductase